MPIRSLLTKAGVLTAHPAAFLIVAVYAIAWLLIEPKTLDMHGLATLATWLMTLFIQRAEHRDTQAIHAKLDALVRGHPGAADGLAKIDQREPEEIEAARKP